MTPACQWRPCGLARLVCYIFAMVLKGLATFAVLLALTQTPSPVPAKATDHSGATRQAPPPSTSSDITPQSLGNPAAKTDCNGFPCDAQQPHVIVTLPAPAPAPWLLRDRIAWGANLMLAIVGYAGIMMALSLLKKIERQTRSAEAAAASAVKSAEAALLNAQAMVDSGRPWVLVTVNPSPDAENSFTVMATNRGRSPARIVGTAEQIMFAIDETHLPKTPEFENDVASFPLVPIILLPGESAEIKPFCRDDLNGICDSEERLRRVENWEEKVYIYGKIVYRDLNAPTDKQIHETAWCCWYIHGRQKSGLVFAGPPEYNSHT